MKTKLLINFLLFTFSFLLCPAQTPQGFNYQAIARDGSGNPIVGATIKVKLSILTDTAGFRAGTGGTYLWEEEHLNVLTNAFGLFNIVLGDPLAIKTDGSAASFSVINWSLTDLYLGTKIANPSTYMVLGAAKLWSVPYALRAKETDQWQTDGANIYKQTGNVGIGTIPSPAYKLDVAGRTRIRTGFGSAGIHFMNNANTLDRGLIGMYNDDNVGLYGAGGAGWGLVMNVINGNVGIGTTTPTAILNPYKAIGDGLNNASEIMNLTIKPTFSTHLLRFYGTRKVAGTSWNDVSLRIQQRVDATDMGYIEFNPGSGAQDLAFGTSNTERLRISGAGNVGIGTNNPLALFHVAGNTRLNNSMFGDGIELMAYATGNRYSGIDFHSDDTYGDFALRILRENTGPNANSLIIHRGLGELVLWTQDAAPITFSTTSVERLRITPTGNVGIGTNNPGAYKLNVNGGSLLIGDGTGVSGTLKLTGHSYIGSADWGNLTLSSGTNTGSAYMALVTENQTRLFIAGGGNVGIGTTTPGSKMVIQPPATWDDNVPLFEVKNKYGTPVLAVYNNGVRILVAHDAAKGVTKGGFAIGGFDNTKAMGETVNLMTVAPDSIRFNIDNDNTKGITKGGFAIGSFDVTKGINVNPKEFMNMTPLGSTTGQFNTFLGYQAGSKNRTGYENTFVGYLAGYNLTDPRFTVAIGKEAASQTSLITGFDIPHQGVYIGTGAGKNGGGGYNVMVGNYAGENNHGGFNVFLGQQAGQYSTSMNSVFIGTLAGANETADNKLIIAGDLGNCKLITGNFGSGGSSYVVIAGTDPNSRTFFVNGSAGGWSAWANVSDVRFKRDIVTIPDALSKISQMRGVNFNWKDSLAFENDKQIGFIAQEVEKILPEVVSKDAKSGRLFLEYAPITALLVEAMKEQQLQIESQQKQIESTKEENQQLRTQLQSLQEKMDRIEAMLAKGGVK